MLDDTSTMETETETEPADAFTLFEQEPVANQQQHPGTTMNLSATMSQPANTDVYQDANGTLRLKLSE